MKNPKLCNKCQKFKKYPNQGLCKICFYKKIKKRYLKSRPPKEKIPNLPNERWRNLNEAKGYQISNYGRIKSLNYYGEKGRHRILKLRQVRKNSYFKIDLDKYNIRPFIHRLVAIYFIKNKKNKEFVNHIDGNKQNNYYKNLEWVTKSENQKHAAHILKNIKKRKDWLKKEDVIKIYNSSETVQNLCIKYNISATHIWAIKNGIKRTSITEKLKK